MKLLKIISKKKNILQNSDSDIKLKKDCYSAKEELLENIKMIIDDLSDDDLIEVRNTLFDEKQPDLFSFFAELSALKQEVKLLNRMNNKSSNQYSESINAVKDLIENNLTYALDSDKKISSVFQDEKKNFRKKLFLEIISLRETLLVSIENNENSKISSFLKKLDKYDLRLNRKSFSRKKYFRDYKVFVEYRQKSLKKIKGHLSNKNNEFEILLAKLDDFLRRYSVVISVEKGDKFDPSIMRAVDTIANSGFDTGTVAEVYRRAYRIEDEIIQLAEVQVERH